MTPAPNRPIGRIAHQPNQLPLPRQPDYSGFVTSSNDAVDALVYLILGLVGDGIEEQKVHYV